MVKPTQFAPPVQQKSYLASLPAPVGGLNERDALAQMDPTQAVILENFFPTHAGVQVRNGWWRYYDKIPGPTETIIKYNGPNGQEQIIACANHSFINVSLGGIYAIGDVQKSGFHNNRWQYTQLANLAGDFTVAVNGDDTPQYYDGTLWHDAVITADAIKYPTFDPKKLIHVALMHRRLWFVEKDSARTWYLPVDAVMGQVSLWPLGEVFPLGGYCQLCMSWSVDTGAGMDDQSIFLSSKGNIAVYSGFDPDATVGTDGAYTLVGTYTIGASIGRRCACPYGSDVLLLTENGAMSLTTVLAQSKLLQPKPITDIIQHRISELVTQFATLFGWDLFTSARYNQLYLNIPDPDGTYQYVMNTILEAWCVVKGFNSVCWENFYEEPVYGAYADATTNLSYIGRAWSGNVDDPDPDTNVGTSIQTRCLQAFNNFGSGVQKAWSLARPIFLSNTQPVISLTFNTDYEVVEDVSPLPPAMSPGALYAWDVALWDAGQWLGEPRAWKPWKGLNDIGFTGGVFLRTNSIDDTVWLSTDFQFIKGGTL